MPELSFCVFSYCHE